MTNRGHFIRWRGVAPLVLAVLLVYANTLRAPFLFDDNGAVVENPTIRRLATLDIFRPPANGSTTTGRPLVNASYAVNWAWSGESVWSYHAINLAIHAAAVLALFGLLRRTFASTRTELAADRLAFFAALLWALHPLQTESVTCVAQRTESLCGLLYLLTLYAFARGWLGVAVVASALGMASKEVMVTAPLVVLLYDRTFVAGRFSTALRQRAGFYVALAATWLVLLALLVRGGGTRGASAGLGLGVTPWSYLLKQCEALVLYLRLAVWPHPLVLDYGTAVAPSVAEVWWQGLLILALLAASGWALWRRPVVGFAAAAFFLILAPSSSVVPLVTQTMAEHRMYLALAPLAVLAVAFAASRLGEKLPWVMLPLAGALACATVARNSDYRDNVTIWARNVADYATSARGHSNLGWALQRAGRAAEANAQFARAIELQPGYVAAHYDWGVALLEQKRADEAIAQFRAAVQLAPGHVDAWLYLGNALVQTHRSGEAVTAYEQALRLAPAADAHFNLGVALEEAGRRDEAAAHFAAALQLNPKLTIARVHLARLAEAAGDVAAAEADYNAALQIDPGDLGVRRQLGLLLAKAERLPAAAEQFRAVLRVQPDDVDAQANLGNVLLLQGDARGAIACYEKVLALHPDDRRAQENLQLARAALR